MISATADESYLPHGILHMEVSSGTKPINCRPFRRLSEGESSRARRSARLARSLSARQDSSRGTQPAKKKKN